MTSILDTAVDRQPLGSTEGKSGSRLERVLLSDGRALVVKTSSPADDWLMRALGDTGRIGRLWASGLLDRVPAVIDHTVLAVEPEGEGWRVVMRDASGSLVTDDAWLSRADSTRIMTAAAALHAEFWGETVHDLCGLAALYGFLAPKTASRPDFREEFIPRLALKGWERFAEVAPADVGAAVFAILDDVGAFARAFAPFTATVIHGDLKLSNLGLTEDRVVMLDWGTQTAHAPPAVEFAWYLGLNASSIDAGFDELVDDIRTAGGERHDEDALQMALLGAVVQLGWDKALQVTESPDPAARAREVAGFDWWIARARDALEQWSP